MPFAAPSKPRFFRPQLESLESRLTPTVGPQSTLISSAPANYDSSSGTLTLLSSSAQLSESAKGVVTVSVSGQSALSNVTGSNLRQINAPGSLTLIGSIATDGPLAITAASLTIDGTLSATALTLTSNGLINVDKGSSVTATTITATAGYFVDVGQVGTDGGSITISTPDYLNAGVLASPGGTIGVRFTESYIDTTGAVTSVSSESGAGGQVTIDGGATGRLFSSGQMIAQGRDGGSIDLMGQDVLLIADKLDASGTVRSGGRVHVMSENSTKFTGVANAHQTGLGAGGSIEISSHGALTYGGTADAGKGGTLLLDPKYLVISEGMGSIPQYELVNPAPGGGFGDNINVLNTGNILVLDPAANNRMGAVYLFNGSNGSLISTLTGSTSATNGVGGDFVGSGPFNGPSGNYVEILANGSYVIQSPDWNGQAGAATWANGTSGVSGVISATNSLVGSAEMDQIGANVVALSNGNFVAYSSSWNSQAGAATWGSGITGIQGPVSSSNSLVGMSGDQVAVSVIALANGNYVVSSPRWNSAAGAATWGNGSTGTAGQVTASNSLTGSASHSQLSFFVTALTNGNYVVQSVANNSLNAATWGNGSTGTTGSISAGNSLVETLAAVGISYQYTITPLTNGNYVVSNQTNAVTWCSGATATTGTVSASNSLVVASGYGNIGTNFVALTNGNYLVCSPDWNKGAGAVTWGNGATGTTGTVSASNSLIGSLQNEGVGGSITQLTNGNYLVDTLYWNGGQGAVTWGSGTVGVAGAVSASNSLVGSSVGYPPDDVGMSVLALTNGNYVVRSPYWDNQAGAVTWGNGASGIKGVVSSSNSLVGSAAPPMQDQVGIDLVGLTNGDYVVISPSWGVSKGAVTWANGNNGIVGTISAANSLIGTISFDQAGSGSVATLVNGNYVVASPNWSNGLGAATWSSGAKGIVGAISNANSLTGNASSGINDLGDSFTALPNGDLVIYSHDASNGRITWVNGTTGATFDGQATPDAQNSLIGNGDILPRSVEVSPGPSAGSFITVFSTGTPGQIIVGLPYSSPNQTTIDTPSFITNSLNAGNNVVLQADDDVSIDSPIIASPTGKAGNLTIKAGRSILINANINTAGGNLILIANDTKADGIVDSDRDPGNAVISMQTGTTINTGSGSLYAYLLNATDKTNHDTGVVTLADITAASATISIPTGTNTLVLTPGGGTFMGSSASVTLNTVPTVDIIGNTNDVAYLYDKTGQNVFAATPSYSFFEGAGFYNQDVGFGTVNAFGATGTNDSAYLYDAGGNNVFVGTPGYSYLTNAIYFNQVIGFKSANAFATSKASNDASYLFDNGGSNTFVGGATASSLQGSGYFNQAVGFQDVYATSASGANDSAYFTGAASGNVFTANTAYSYMYGPGYLNEVLGFKSVSATGASTDTASLYDGSGTNTYFATGFGGSLVSGSITEAETGFGYVNIVQSLGTFDTATTKSLAFSLTKVGTWH